MIKIAHRADIPFKLGRHIPNDPRSENFRFKIREGLAIRSVVWSSSGQTLDQGQLSSCCGNAGAQLLNCDLYLSFRHKIGKAFFNEHDAVNIYSLATHLDGDGPDQFYPPHDDGSTGVGLGNALKKLNYIDRYEHCTTMQELQAALQKQPVCVGTLWTQGMFNTDASGYVVPDDLSDQSKIAGGHEYLCRGLSLETNSLVFRQSWGPDWSPLGHGTFMMKIPDFQRLLDAQGDVIVPHVLGTP